jgi:hypothetical protein
MGQPAPFPSDVVVSRCVVSTYPISSRRRASSRHLLCLSGLPTADLGIHASPRGSTAQLPLSFPSE